MKLVTLVQRTFALLLKHGYVLQYSLVCVLILLLTADLTDGVCPANSKTSPVAEMCRESQAEGTRVYIDTRPARETDNGTGILCQCHVTFINDVTLFKYNMAGSKENCGSKLSLNVSNSGSFVTDEKNCSANGTETLRTVSADISIEKVKGPFNVDYCVELNLTCTESQTYCNLLDRCIDAGNECKANGNQTSGNSTKNTDPKIKVTCTLSQRFSTTTTTTKPSTTTTTPTTSGNHETTMTNSTNVTTDGVTLMNAGHIAIYTTQSATQGMAALTKSVTKRMAASTKSATQGMAASTMSASQGMVASTMSASQGMVASTKSATQRLAASTKSASQGMVASTMSASQGMVASTKSATQRLAASTKSATQGMAASTKSATKRMAASTKSATQRMTHSTKSVTRGMEASTKSATKRMAASTKSVTQGMATSTKSATQRMSTSAKSATQRMTASTQSDVEKSNDKFANTTNPNAVTPGPDSKVGMGGNTEQTGAGTVAAIFVGSVVGMFVLGIAAMFIRKTMKNRAEDQPTDLWIPTNNAREMTTLNP